MKPYLSLAGCRSASRHRLQPPRRQIARAAVIALVDCSASCWASKRCRWRGTGSAPRPARSQPRPRTTSHDAHQPPDARRLAATAASPLFAAQGNAAMTDLILVNAKVTTLDRENPEAQAIAIRDGKFLCVAPSRGSAPPRPARR